MIIIIIIGSEYGRNDSTYNSHTDKWDYVYNLKAINNKNIDDEYKDDNLKYHNSNEIDIMICIV